jgi:hypothetical protein
VACPDDSWVAEGYVLGGGCVGHFGLS